MGNILGLNKKTAINLLDNLSNELFIQHGFPCKLYGHMPIFIARTYNDDDGYVTSVEIGIDVIQNARSLIPFKSPSISDVDFATVVLNMYHEQNHCIHKNHVFRQSNLDECSARQLVQEIACRDNPDYYMGNSNYRINANEIQAEQYGIMNAYEYLCDEFSDVDPSVHEAIIVDIVNDKMQKSSYFVHQDTPFTSLDEIERAFDDAYDASFMTKRMYVVNRNIEHDAVKRYMRDHADCRSVYLSADDPLEQDRCIAAINCKIHPEYLKLYPALTALDLSYESVITKPYRVRLHQKDTTTIDAIVESWMADKLRGDEPEY